MVLLADECVLQEQCSAPVVRLERRRPPVRHAGRKRRHSYRLSRLRSAGYLAYCYMTNWRSRQWDIERAAVAEWRTSTDMDPEAGSP